MNPLDDNSPERLALDARFRRWVLEPDAEADRFWQAWLADDPVRRQTAQEARKLVHLLVYQPAVLAEDQETALWADIRERVQQVQDDEAGNVRPLGLRRRTWLAVAASVAVVLLAGWAAWLTYGSPWQTIQATAANGMRVALADGSVVVLKAQSSLRYRSDQLTGTGPREVWLEGEGYFDVRHARSAENRFIVHLKAVDVQVLGTTFTALNRPDGMARVVLQTGSVRLSGQALPRPELMQPGDLVEVQALAGGPKLVRRRVYADLYTSWKDDRLTFQNTPMDEVARVIEARYGYRVQFSDPAVRSEQLTFAPIQDDFEVLVKLLSESFTVRINHDTHVITISPSNTN